jgi:preprotein translocase subunit SecF
MVITIGLYALVGFTVSPATVIALLTILGYSLYDTVVVFDRVKDNAIGARRAGRRTTPSWSTPP